jgi:hypothetical protein
MDLGRSPGRLLLAGAAAGLVVAGCASPGPQAARPERIRDAPAAYALPEPDPGCRATVQEPLAAHGLERVTIKVAVGAGGKPVLVEFLSPDLTPAAMLELRRAVEQCVWKPEITPDGQARAWTTTFVRLRP